MVLDLFVYFGKSAFQQRRLNSKDNNGNCSFNVIVVYEAAPVIYKNGSAAADWSQAIEIIQTGG